MTTEITTLEQSKRLLEAGLNPNTADLYYTIFDGNSIPHLTIPPITEKDWKNLYPQVYTPCWSVAGLMRALPVSSALGNGEENGKKYWICKYIGEGSSCGTRDGLGDTQIEACINLITRLLEEGIIEK